MNMKTKINIKDKINDTLNSVDTINDVTVSPFFKDKAMQLLFVEKEEKQTRILSWFTPQFQLATLACVIILNVFAFTKLKETTYNENVGQFAESYGLVETTETSLFN